MLTKTAVLIGSDLDWAVEHAQTLAWEAYDAALFADKPLPTRPCEWVRNQGHDGWDDPYSPSTNWAQGGPIIDSERISFHQYENCPPSIAVVAYQGNDAEWKHKQFGTTPLIAAMRCYVASKLGDDVDIPLS
jgi:hypothetical protein